MKCLAKESHGRFQTAMELMKTLEQYRNTLNDETVSGSTTSDVIVVESPLAQPCEVQISSPVIRVGRALENEIVLDHPSVSRTHARIERGVDNRYRVRDVSYAGCSLGGELLVKDKPQEWHYGDVLLIETFRLILRRGSADWDTERKAAENVPPVPAPEPFPQPSLRPSVTSLSLVPSVPSQFTAEITNMAQIVMHYLISIHIHIVDAVVRPFAQAEGGFLAAERQP